MKPWTTYQLIKWSKTKDQPTNLVIIQKKKEPNLIVKTNKIDPTTSTPTFNPYAELTDNESEIEIQTAPTVKLKIPPIVVINMQHSQITSFMQKIVIINYNLKYISLGIKILLNTISDFNITINNLKLIKAEYFSHDIPSQKTTKFVLSGLPNLTIEQVKQGLTSANLKFVDVKKMRTRHERDDFALFLVYFDNKVIKLQELKQIKYVFNETRNVIM